MKKFSQYVMEMDGTTGQAPAPSAPQAPGTPAASQQPAAQQQQGNPIQTIQQAAKTNPQLAQALQALAKNPELLKQFAAPHQPAAPQQPQVGQPQQ